LYSISQWIVTSQQYGLHSLQTFPLNEAFTEKKIKKKKINNRLLCDTSYAYEWVAWQRRASQLWNCSICVSSRMPASRNVRAMIAYNLVTSCQYIVWICYRKNWNSRYDLKRVFDVRFRNNSPFQWPSYNHGVGKA